LIQYEPNGFGEPSQVSGLIDSIDYWPNGSLRNLDFANGVKTHLELNTEQRLSAETISAPAGGVIAHRQYEYDASGNPTLINNIRFPAESVTLQHDGLARLVTASGSWGDESFHYDATDNLIARYGATPEMQLNIDYRQLPATSEIDGEVKQVSHDARGNMITDGDFDYAFNAASQLTSIAQFPGMSFRYDGHGRRLISADESGSRYSLYNRAGALMYVDGCEQGGEVSEFVYLADDPVARLDSECADGCHP